MTIDVDSLLVPSDASIRDVVARIDSGGVGIALVTAPDRRLVGTVTDGDIRRAVLAGAGLGDPVNVLLERQRSEPYPTPFTAPIGTSSDELLHLMNEHTIRHIPLVDDQGRVVELALLSELVREYELPLRAVVMAGGYGMRLRPLTDNVPKPMLPVGERPLLELIVDQLRDAGVRRVNVTTHYRGEEIERHFGDGQDFGVEIHYVPEEEPLGTAGALALLEESDEPLLVMNGDILTRVDFRALLQFHREHDADMTVAVRPYEVQVPYGIVETDGLRVVGISEKPVVRHFVNAGIYVLSPRACRYVPAGERHDMPDLMEQLLADALRVISFPIHEYWLDIGQPEAYERAQRELEGI